MFYQLNEKEQEIIKKAQNYTIADYEVKGDFIEADALMECIEDLVLHIEWMEENED